MAERITGNIRDIIFDLDGTLVDSAPSILSCMSAALSSHGIEPIVPLTDALIGPPLKDTLCKISGVQDPAALDAMAESFKTHYDTAGYRETSVYPEVHRMLESLVAAGLSLHIATNKRVLPTHQIIRHLGWSELFRSVYATDSRSPAFSGKGEMIEYLMTMERLDASSVIYVGDRRDDELAALKNGVQFIAVMWGYGDFDLSIVNGTSFFIDKPEQLIKYLAES